MTKAFIPLAAAGVLLALSLPVAAGPANTLSSLERASDHLSQVQHRDRDGERRRHSQGYVAGRHYHEAPSGWRRHGRGRPHDWHTRGCIVVGGSWFCP